MAFIGYDYESKEWSVLLVEDGEIMFDSEQVLACINNTNNYNNN